MASKMVSNSCLKLLEGGTLKVSMVTTNTLLQSSSTAIKICLTVYS